MQDEMSKRQIKKWKKDIAKDIYQDTFKREQTKLREEQRLVNVKKIQEQAKEDAKMNMSGKGTRIGKGIQRMQRGAMKFQKKRMEISKMVEPYIKNLNDTFDMNQYQKKKPPKLF